jgi:hypothetical protein
LATITPLATCNGAKPVCPRIGAGDAAGEHRGFRPVAVLAGFLCSGPTVSFYDPVLTVTLLLGAAAAAPSILALNYANYSNRGDLLVAPRTATGHFPGPVGCPDTSAD